MFRSSFGYEPDFVHENYRRLRRHALFVSGCFIAYFILQELLSALILYEPLGLSGHYYSNPAFQYAVAAFAFSFVALGLPFLIYSSKKGSLSYFRVLPFHTPQPAKKLICLVLAGWGVCMAANYICAYVGVFFSVFDLQELTPELPVSENWLDVLMNFVCAAVMAPLIEELVFRGVIMQPLRRYGNGFAVVISSLLFALVHGTPSNVVFAFISGLAIGFAVIYSRSIWVGIIIHALNNGFSVLFSELTEVFSDSVDALFSLYYIGIIIIGALAFLVFAFSYGLKLGGNSSGLTLGRRLKAVFLSVPMIVVLVYIAFILSISVV